MPENLSEDELIARVIDRYTPEEIVERLGCISVEALVSLLKDFILDDIENFEEILYEETEIDENE